VNEFAGWSEKFDSEAITPLLNKVGQLVSTNMIRNIIGQPKNSFNIRDIINLGVGEYYLKMSINCAPRPANTVIKEEEAFEAPLIWQL
jgi:hypothetical protein